MPVDGGNFASNARRTGALLPAFPSLGGLFVSCSKRDHVTCIV